MSDTPMNVRELRARMDAGLAAFEAALDRLSEEQLTGPRDHVGWTVRDHLTHLAAWADGITALLRGEERWQAMGITPTLATNTPEPQLDFDVINERIAERHRGLSGAEARALVVAAHRRLAAEVDKLTDEQLAWPYKRFGTPATGDGTTPIAEYIAGDSYGHYDEHLGWIEEIAAATH
jgi:uncharacterized damage-inducible protein DinB